MDGQGRVYVPFDLGLIAVNPNTGQTLWWQQQGGLAPVAAFRYPVIGRQVVIYVVDDRYLNAIGQPPSTIPILSLLLQ